MSYANGTTNYNLPQTVATDKRDWSDTNTAFAAVDAALKTAVDGVATDAAAITEIQADLNTPSTGIKARLTAVEAENTTQGTAIATLQETSLLHGTAINNLETAVAGSVKDSAVADPYSAASTYAVGDVVMYQGVRYECTTAIATAEPFDASHWQAKDIESVIGTHTVSVNGDGVKTYETILNELYAKVAALNLSDEKLAASYIMIGTRRFNYSTPNHYTNVAVEGTTRSLIITLTLAASGSTYTDAADSGSTTAFTDRSANTVSSTTVISFIG